MGVPAPPEPEPIPGAGSGGDSDSGSSSSSGSSGSSSSGGSSEPAVDPVVAQKMNLFQSIYMGLWGEPATEAYLKAAANSGLNTWEFAAAERAKPAWADTDAYKSKADELATMLANLGVG